MVVRSAAGRETRDGPMPVDVDAATFVRADTGTAIRTIHDILGFSEDGPGDLAKALAALQGSQAIDASNIASTAGTSPLPGRGCTRHRNPPARCPDAATA